MKSLTITGLFVILLLATQAASQELTSTLHSTLYGVEIAYVDEMIVFTCVVRGSDNMAWTSEEYIGTGGQQLPFAAAEPEGNERRAIGNDQTVATLITAVNTGDIMIVSELRITIKSTYPLASVQCISRGADIATVNSTSFQLAAATSVTCDRQFLCPGEMMVTCVCATANSSALVWTFNDTRLNFTSNNATLSRRDLPGSNGLVVLTENSIVNGIRVIMSNITVSASSSDVILTCGNVDQNMIEPITVPMIETCPVSPSGATPTGSDNSGNSSGPIVAAVVVPVILVILIIIAIVIVIILLLKFQTGQKGDEIQKLKTALEEKENQLTDKVKEFTGLQQELDALEQRKALQEDTIQKLQADQQKKENQLTGKVKEFTGLQRELKTLEQTKKIQEEAIRNLQAGLQEKDNQLTDKVGKLKDLQQELSQEKEKAAAAAEDLKTSMKEEHTAALKLMEENMKKGLKDAFEALKETMKKSIKERMNGETSVDPKKGKGKTSKQTFEDEMEKGIDTTSSRLENLLEEEIKTVLKEKKKDTEPEGTTPGLGIFGKGRF